MNCPHCGKEINVGTLLGSVSSPAKTRAARENAKLGGWPKGKPRKPESGKIIEVVVGHNPNGYAPLAPNTERSHGPENNQDYERSNYTHENPRRND